MCGRFTSTTSAADLADWFEVEEPSSDTLPIDFNVVPTSDIRIVRVVEGRRRLDIAHWGLVPGWAESPAIGSRLINARSETAASKPSFRRAFRRRRCLVPVDGFYEWVPVSGRRRKQPHYLRAHDARPLALAGLWEEWCDPERPGHPSLVSCTILTGPPNAVVAPLHDRMPIILDRPDWEPWLDPDIDDVDLLTALCVPAPDDLLETWPVSTAVNDVHRHDSTLLERVVADVGDDGQARLF